MPVYGLRRLCRLVLNLIAVPAVFAAVFTAPAVAQVDPALNEELTQALNLTPDPENGRKLYRNCADCHTEKGWGSADGVYPQIAGQHVNVIIKQIIDIRFGLRENPVMLPYVERDALGGPKAISDVAGYIAALPMDPNPGVGPGKNLKRGEDLFDRKCAVCHLLDGEGEDEILFPKITGQHYAYLLRELTWMKEGKRQNAYRGMLIRIRKMTAADLEAVADYISRLKNPNRRL